MQYYSFFFTNNIQKPLLFFFSSRRRHTRSTRDWSSDVCSSDLPPNGAPLRLQRKVELPSLEEKLNDAPVEFVGFAGEEPIVVSGGVVSSVNERPADHEEGLPAVSTARAWNPYVPSPSADEIVQVPFDPFVVEGDEPERSTVPQRTSVQTRNSTVPVSATSALANVAVRSDELVVAPAAGETSVGVLGNTVSSRKLRDQDQPEVPPALSAACACQYQVPSD